MLKNQKGITLISLVITIIVMLILAVVTISSAVGEGSILNQAGNARKETNIGRYKEEFELISLAENTKYRLQEVTFAEEVNNIESSILAKDYVESVDRKPYSDGVILEVKTNEDIISMDCRETGVNILEGTVDIGGGSEVEEEQCIYNYFIIDEEYVNNNYYMDDSYIGKVMITGFNLEALDHVINDEIKYTHYSSGNGIIINNMPTLNIPAQINGVDVVAVDFSKYRNEYAAAEGDDMYIQGITKIVFPTTVKYIGRLEFFIDVTDVDLNEGLETLYHTFWFMMDRMNSLTIPSTVENICDTFRGDVPIVITVKGKTSINDFETYDINDRFWCSKITYKFVD